MGKKKMQIKCIEKKADGSECGLPMLMRHEDTDRMYNPIQWYKCKLGHWRAIPIKESK